MRLLYILLFLSLFACLPDESPPAPTCDESSLNLSLIEIVDATSCSIADGSLTVKAVGGVGPYTYTLGGSQNTEGTFDGLSSGGYTVEVKDSKGCIRTLPNIIVAAGGFSFDAQIVADTECVGGNGSIAISLSEGTPPFAFRFEGGPASDNGTFADLNAGTYEVGVSDAEGCSASLSITIPAGSTGTSWLGEIRPLIETHCALSGCHNGVSRPDLRLYDKAKFYASQIKSLTADKSMPFEGSLTQDQIDLIACWVDEGAQNN